MRHVVIPAEHSNEDLVLAGQLVHALDSDTLYVAWTTAKGPAAPAIEARIGEVRRRPSLFGSLVANVAAAVHTLLSSPSPRPARRGPATGHAQG